VKLRALLGAEAVRELRVTPGRTRGD